MSLFKKGEKAATKPKKPLFGKKANNDDNDTPTPPKKTGFSLTKKRTATTDDGEPVSKTSKATNKKAKPTKSGAKAGLDTSKLIPILGGLLALIVLGLAAKMFLFSEPEPEPVVPTIPPPTAPAPQQPAPAPAAPTEVATATPVAEVAPAPTPTAESTPAQQPQQPAPVPADNPAVAPQAEPPAAHSFTREDFLRESKNRIYRERETSQPNP